MDRHVHIKLDKYGYCEDCNVRVLTHFAGFPLPDRPKIKYRNWTPEERKILDRS